MASSIHDNLLTSYEVQCEARTIVLRTEHRAANQPTEYTNVSFEGVQGYRFGNDSFGNIIFDVEAVPIEKWLNDYGDEIKESYRAAGSPGSWAADLGSAAKYLRDHGIKGYILRRLLGCQAGFSRGKCR